ncbi:MAG TPA: metal ABC transporter ATP-binding protein [Myxococcaceae bacterium]|nr:metal ABC transporter ATP-binding protein [Myxococcaceae bacterium]
MDLLTFDNVAIGYRRGQPLLPPISFAVASGDLVGILGPNGAGKSTFLRTLLGLLPPLQGKVRYPGGHEPRMGYVPQNAQFDYAYPLSVLEVVLMARSSQLGLFRRPGKEDVEIAKRELQAVGLQSISGQPFRSLSGGQQQRVLVARALTGEPELLVLDEPTSNMDPAAEHALLSMVSSLTATRNVAVVFVTHEISAAAEFARTVVLLDGAKKFFALGPAREIVTSETMSALYGRPVEVRRENGRVFVWLSANGSGGASP